MTLENPELSLDSPERIAKKNHYIKFFRDNGFNCFPIPQYAKAADSRYDASRTKLDQPITDNENFGFIACVGSGNVIIDFDDKEKYRQFAESKIIEGFMIIESPYGWHLPVKNLKGNFVKRELFENGKDKKSIEIQCNDHYCVGAYSLVYDKFDGHTLRTYQNRGTDKIFDALGNDLDVFVDYIADKFKLTAKTKKEFSLQGGVKIGTIHNTLMSYGRSFLNKTNPNWEVFKAAMIAWSATNEGDDYKDRPRQFEKDLEDIWNYYQNDLANGKLKTVDDTKKISKDNKIIDDATELIKSKYNFVTLRETDETLLYDGKIYNKVKAESIIKEETEKIIENCTTHNRNEVVNKIKTLTYPKIDDMTGKPKEFDSDPKLITLDNGILNLETLELSPHTPEYLSRVLIPVEFKKPVHEINDNTIFEDIEKNIEGTLFYQFLKRSFTVNGDFRKKDFETVLEIIASPIIKRHIDEKAFMFLGGGENGKSVCLDYIKSLIGESNISRIPLQDIAEDKFMRAGLAGKSANVFTDLEAGEMKHTGKIKAITSGEGIEAQEKYKDPFTLYPFCKLMFSCNRFPKIYDQSQGFFRRWIIVKWDRNFENDPERIEYLREKLAENLEEKTVVFSCLVYLARKLNRVGKFTHTTDWKTTQKEWNENADPVDDFVNNYIIDSDIHKTKRETFRFYKEIMLSKGESPLTMGKFSKAFEEYYDSNIEKIDGKTERVWLNIDFKRPIQTTLKEHDE